MDFINKAYAQLVELFRSMSPATRIAAGLLLAVIVVSLGWLFQYQGPSGDEYLLDGRPFSSSELTSIEASFAKAGLGGSTLVGNRIRIPRGQKNAYLGAMADGNALPADFYKYLDDAAASDNPFASNQSLQLKQANAKMKELALVVSRMQGIEAATVQYDEEARPGLARDKRKTAMVAVWTTGGALADDQVKSIRNLVASAYAGLDRHAITITDATNNLTYGGSVGPDGSPEGENLYANYKVQYERVWQRKIAEQLAMIPGVIVGVNVEMNPETQRASQSVKLEPKPVTLRSQESSKETVTKLPNTAGRVGAIPNGVGNQPVSVQATSSSSGESTSNEQKSDTNNVTGHQFENSNTAPLVPKKVTAAIDVPASYYAKVWREQNPIAAGQQPKQPDAAALSLIETATRERIKETVRNLLPPVIAGTDPYPHITVSTYTDFPALAPTPPLFAAQATTWLADNWQTIGLVLLGCFSLLMVRSMVRSAVGSPPPAPVAHAHASRPVAAPEPEEEIQEPAVVLRKRFQGSGPDLRSELQELVKENPDAAANVLRLWIGDAA